MNSSLRVGASAFCVLAAGALALATSQSTITPPGGFVQSACYSSSCGCGIVPGQDMSVLLGTPIDFHEQLFSGISSATVSSAFTNGTITNSASGRTGMGFAHMLANNTSPNSTFFSLGAANGGWKETFTVTHPTQTGAGFLLFTIRGHGTLHASGFAGASGITTTGYKDNVELAMNSFFDRGGSDPIGTDRQRAQWSVSSGPDISRTVGGDTVTMSVPFTFGQPFTLGVYAWARAGQRSSSGFAGSSHGDIDFTIEWGGITGVMVGGSPVSGFTVTSGSGIDWSQPVPACPGDVSGNQSVGLDDVAAIIQCWSQPASCNPAADLDGNGTIGIGDMAAVIANWNTTCL